MSFPKSLLIPTLTITTLGVLILGGVMMGDKQQSLEVQNTTFTTQQVVPTITVSGSTETMTTIDPNTCMTTEIPVCKKRFWKDFDEKTCKQIAFEVDCMFYDEVSTNQQEYGKLLSEYGLVGREETSIGCDALLIETIIINGYACEEKDLGRTIPDTNTKGMCRDNSRTCRTVMRDGKEILLRDKNLATRYDPTGKTEICDGRDNDCDGQVDEGFQQKEYLRDFDGDGRGNIDMKTKACFPPPGHVLKAGDCDDLDKEVYPGAFEVCDLKDNNCNRQIDEYLEDCNEEVKECTMMLPLGGNGELESILLGEESFINEPDSINESIVNIDNELEKLYKKYPGDIGKIQKVAKMLTSFDDDETLKGLMESKGEIRVHELLTILAESRKVRLYTFFSDDLIELYFTFKDIKGYQSIISIMVNMEIKNNGESNLIEYYWIYENEYPNAVKIFEDATKYYSTFRAKYGNYQNHPNALNIFKNSCEKNINECLEYYYNRFYFISNANEYIKELIGKADKISMSSIKQLAEKKLISDREINQALNKISDKDRIENYNRIKTYDPNALNKLMQLITKIKCEDIVATFESLKQHLPNELPNLIEIITNALQYDTSGMCILNIYLYNLDKTIPNTDIMFTKKIQENPLLLLSYNALKKKNSNPIIDTLWNQFAHEIPLAYLIRYYSTIKNNPNVFEILLEKISNNGALLILNHLKKDDLFFKQISGEQLRKIQTAMLHENNFSDLLFLKIKDIKDLGIGGEQITLTYPENNILFNELNDKIFTDLLKITTIKIGLKHITIEGTKNVNMYAGILKTYLRNKQKYTLSNGSVDRESAKIDYEINITKFISAGKNFSQNNKVNTFIVRADTAGGDDLNGAITSTNDQMIDLFQCLGEQGTCTSIRSNEKTMTPDKIISIFAKQIHDDPEGYHLFNLGGHGAKDGSLELAGGNWKKEHFDKLFNLQVAYPGRIRIHITSCNSAWKDDDRYNNQIGNIALDSSQQSSIGKNNGADHTLIQAFEHKDSSGKLEADYDGDGVVNYHEALIYRAIHYNLSLTPIMFDDNGKVIDIVGADLFPQDIQDRSDRENDPFVDTQCSMDC